MRDPVSIRLDSDNVILRTIGEEEPEPAVLSGSVVLDLHEKADIKDILLSFSGRAHITYTDAGGNYKTHNMDTPIFYHDHSFLPSFGGKGDSQTHSSSHVSLSGLNRSRQSSDNLNGLGEHAAGAPGSSSTGHPSSDTTTSHLDHSHSAHSQVHHNSSSKHHGSHHSHRFNPGLHQFPFAFHIPGSLPASVRVNSGASIISYQLKASVTRAGAFAAKWSTKSPVNIVRGLLPEAAEYNQTLEIENTWPGKIMYSLTLPHKAYCAGESIPVALKFTPIGKGVRVTQLVTTIKEHVTVMTKLNMPHNTARDIATKKHNFHSRSALSSVSSSGALSASASASSRQQQRSSGGAHPISVPPSRSGSHTDLASLGNQANRLNLEDHPMLSASGVASGSSAHAGTGSGGHVSPAHPASGTSPAAGHAYTVGGSTVPSTAASSANASRVGSRANSPERVYYGRNVNDPEYVGNVDEDGSEDCDVDAVIQIPIPHSAAPSHQLEPLLVSHKIKWSAFIRNLDGHTSELRCALPIHILSNLLSEEAKLASSGTRSLLFGPSGVLVPAAEGIQQVDLPSYNDHVRDRVADVNTSSFAATITGTGTTTAGSGTGAAASFARSSWATPMTSPQGGAGAGAAGTSPSTSYFPDRNERPINWADSELLSTLSMTLPAQNQASHHSSQSNSRHSSPATSRPGSRPGSRPSSRPTSRASSPVRGESTNNHYATSEADGLSMRSNAISTGSSGQDSHAPPPLQQRSSSGFLGSMHLPRPLRPFTAIGTGDRSHSTGSLGGFFHGSNSRQPSRQSTMDDHSHSSSHRSTPHDSPPLSRGSMSGPSTGLGGSSGDVAAQTIAALEAHQQQEQQQAKKGKGRAGFSLGGKGKGKGKGSMFSSMHAHEDEDHDHQDHDHDNSHEHDHDHHHVANEEPEDQTGARYLSQVPSYDVARRGFLGGGVVPISVGLPSYDESEVLSRPTTPLGTSFPRQPTTGHALGTSPASQTSIGGRST